MLALALGFPIAVVLAWAFDITGGAIERTAPASGPGLRGARLTLVLVGIGLLAAGPGVIKLRKLDGYKKLAGVINAQLRLGTCGSVANREASCTGLEAAELGISNAAPDAAPGGPRRQS